MPEERIFEINENLKAQEEEFFQKWLKIREAKGLGARGQSMKRVGSQHGPLVNNPSVAGKESGAPGQLAP